MGGYVTSGGLFALYMQNMFKTRTGGGGLEGVEALYHAYRDDVFRLALSYTGQIADAEDISQTVFLKLMDHYSRLTPGKEKNWLLKVAANESRSMLRQRRHLVQETIPEIPFAEPQDSLLFELVQALGVQISRCGISVLLRGIFHSGNWRNSWHPALLCHHTAKPGKSYAKT